MIDSVAQNKKDLEERNEYEAIQKSFENFGISLNEIHKAETIYEKS